MNKAETSDSSSSILEACPQPAECSAVEQAVHDGNDKAVNATRKPTKRSIPPSSTTNMAAIIANNFGPLTNDTFPETTDSHHRDGCDGSGGCDGRPIPELFWDEEASSSENYSALAQVLLGFSDLYRTVNSSIGLIALPKSYTDDVTPITTVAALDAYIKDRVDISVMRNGNLKSKHIPNRDLSALLRCESFLSHFPSVTFISKTPCFTDDYSLCVRGFNADGDGRNIIYLGDDAAPKPHLEYTSQFLDVMDFQSNADRTNAVAGLLTVLLRNHFLGAKPILVVTAGKSHGGKGTVIDFMSGLTKAGCISFQLTTWALERNFVEAVKPNEVGVVHVDNARLEGRQSIIASAFLERFATDPHPLLFSTGTGPAVRRRNDIVIAISTNFGDISEDLMNRALPVHLTPVGDVANRVSPIGNPKLEFLPARRSDIVNEAIGMIAKWRKAGCPLDDAARHPFSTWARTIGGILSVNGFTDFLGNYGKRKTVDDPIRKALGILGAASSDQWQRMRDWVHLASDQGVLKQLLPPQQMESDKSKERNLGYVFSAHVGETFEVQTEDVAVKLKLQKARRRFGEGEPQTRYSFECIGAPVKARQFLLAVAARLRKEGVLPDMRFDFERVQKREYSQKKSRSYDPRLLGDYLDALPIEARLPVEWMLLTGWRSTATCTLLEEYIDEENLIAFQVHKGAKEREEPLDEQLLKIIYRAREHRNALKEQFSKRKSGIRTVNECHVFVNTRGQPWNHTSLRQHCQKRWRLAGLPVKKIHELRTTFGTEAGRHYSTSMVQASLGHDSPQSTEHYIDQNAMKIAQVGATVRQNLLAHLGDASEANELAEVTLICPELGKKRMISRKDALRLFA